MAEESIGVVDRTIDGAKSVVHGIAEHTKERFGHPFFYSFVLSFIFYNWRPISLFLFTKRGVEETVEFLYTYDNIGSYGWPFLSALVYTFCFPYIKFGIEWSLLPAKNRLFKSKHDSAINDLIAQQSLATHEKEVADILSGKRSVEATQAIIAEKDSLINQLKETLESKSETATLTIQAQLNEIENLKTTLEARTKALHDSFQLADIEDLLKNTNSPNLNNDLENIARLIVSLMRQPEIDFFGNLVINTYHGIPDDIRDSMVVLLLRHNFIKSFAGRPPTITRGENFNKLRNEFDARGLI